MQFEEKTSSVAVSDGTHSRRDLRNLPGRRTETLDEHGHLDLKSEERQLEEELFGATGPKHEIRQFERVRLYMPGQLFHPANDQALDCKVLDISAGGAAIQCDGNYPRDEKVVLHITRFGRFEGRVVLHHKGVLRIAFVLGEGVQSLLKDMLALFVAKRKAGTTELQESKRKRSISSGFVVCAGGQHLRCDVLDVSLEGVSLRTKARPAIGEIVNLGRNWGKVVRHHEEGIAIHFVKMVPDKAA